MNKKPATKKIKEQKKALPKKTNRFILLSWLIIPILGIWIAANYLIGVIQKPSWENASISSDILGVTVDAIEQADKPTQPYKWSGGGLVTFWLDDAWITQYTAAFPMLQEYNFPAALAVPTKAIGWDEYMSWAQVKRVHHYGWEITAHSQTHLCDSTKFTPDFLKEEINGSLHDLKAHGYFPQTFVPPCGVITPTMVDLVKQYYTSMRTSDQEYNILPIQNPYGLQVHEVQNFVTPELVQTWINEAKLNNYWLILMFHKIDYSYEQYSTTPEIFKQIVTQVKQSEMPVILPRQALNLVKE